MRFHGYYFTLPVRILFAPFALLTKYLALVPWDLAAQGMTLRSSAVIALQFGDLLRCQCRRLNRDSHAGPNRFCRGCSDVVEY
jgi:hypothetical protein